MKTTKLEWTCGILAGIWLTMLMCGCPIPQPSPNPPIVITTTTSTTTTTIPPAPVIVDTNTPAVVMFDGAAIPWGNLKQTCTALVTAAAPSGYTVDFSDRSNWRSSDGHSDGNICAMWYHNGVMVAYYWDGLSVASPYTYVSLHHLSDNGSPIQSVRPAPGDAFGIFCVDETRTMRSTVSWTTWQGI